MSNEKDSNLTIKGLTSNHWTSPTKPVLNYSKIRPVQSPVRGTELSAGLDFFVPEDFLITVVKSHEDILIPSGIFVNMSGPLQNYMFMANDKSGVSTKKKLKVAAKIVDADYQGEIHIHVYNFGRIPQIIRPGDKIAQFILVPVLYANPVEVPYSDLYQEKTDRGSGGFGSTDK